MTNLFVEPAFLTTPECEHIRRAMDAGTAEGAEILDAGITLDDQVRRTLDVDVDEAARGVLEARLETLRARLEDAFGVTLGAREGTSLLRYGTGGFYKPHRDRGLVAGWPAAAIRSVAVVVFLNDGFDGGMLRLYPEGGEAVDVRPAAGMLAAFPADILHEVLPVTRGTRDTGVDWFYDAV